MSVLAFWSLSCPLQVTLLLRCVLATKFVQLAITTLMSQGLLSQQGLGASGWTVCTMLLMFVWPQVRGRHGVDTMLLMFVWPQGRGVHGARLFLALAFCL